MTASAGYPYAIRSVKPATTTPEDALSRAVFEQSPSPSVVLTIDGSVLDPNPAALAHFGVARDRAIGQPIWILLAADAGATSAASLRTAVEQAASGATRTLDDAGHAADGSERTFEWLVRPIWGTDGEIVAIAADARDASNHRRAEHEGDLLVRLALAIAHTDSIELALSAAVQTVCEAAGWVLGESWIPSHNGAGGLRLVRGGVWAKRDPRLDAFASQASGFSFAMGDGLPGAAWQRRETVWARRLADSAEFTRAPLAALAGITAAVAIPILAGDDVIAVMSFYMTNTRFADARLVRVMTAVATQLGPLIQQKQAEEAYRGAEARVSGIVSIALDAIISIDHARRITLFNWGAERIFGYTAGEMIGRSIDDLLPETLRDRHAGHIAQFAASSQMARRMGERSTIVGQRKNGEIFPAEASISRFRAGGQWTFTVILRDITARQRTEDALRFLSETGALLGDLIHGRSILQRVAERAVPTLGDLCIIDLADDTQITTAAIAAATPAATDTARSSRERTPLQWSEPDLVVEVMRHRETRLVSEVMLAGLHTESALIIPLVIADRVLGALTFAMVTSGRQHDDSYRTLADELAVRVALAVDAQALYQRTRDAVGARDEVLAVVSHDLRNPLSAIRMCASALRETPLPTPEAASELLETIEDSATWAFHIIEDLLDVASLDAGRLSIESEPLQLGPVLERAHTMFIPAAAERHQTLDVQTPAEDALPRVLIDSDRILQVLTNLLQNAVKFTPPGGTIRVRALEAPGAVQVSVSDTGPGIAADDITRVFERFWHAGRQSKVRSTGLGLAIARGIIEAHGGRLWVDSTVGQGSTFFFTIPTAARDD